MRAMNVVGHWVIKEGCKELEECTDFSFSSWLIDGPHILRGGGRHLQHREMLPNKGKEAGFFVVFLKSRGLCFSWTKAFVKSFINVAALNRTTLEKKWEQILAGGMLFLKTELQRRGIFKVRSSTGLFTTSRGLQQCRAPHSWISH